MPVRKLSEVDKVEICILAGFGFSGKELAVRFGVTASAISLTKTRMSPELSVSRAARTEEMKKKDREVLKLLDGGFKPSEVAHALGIASSAVSRAKTRNNRATPKAKLTDEQVEEVKRLLDEGHTHMGAAKHSGVSHSAVSRISIKENGRQHFRGKNVSDEEVAGIMEMWVDGYKTVDIAKKFNRHRNTVSKVIHENK